METDRQILTENWRAACAALSVKFVGPFKLFLTNGDHYEFAGLVAEFGSARGTLVDTQYDRAAFAAAKVAGFACSTMGADTSPAVDTASYAECLSDWGWCGQGRAPEWYTAAA